MWININFVFKLTLANSVLILKIAGNKITYFLVGY